MSDDLLRLAARHACAYLDSLEHRDVRSKTGTDALRAALGRELTDRGVPAGTVLDDLVRDAEDGLLHTGSPRFFGWVIGGALPVSIAADWLTSVWDQNAAASACSPSAAVVEEVVGGWLRDLFGLPGHSSFAFVTGCQMAHVTALAAARHRVLERHGRTVEREGLSGAPAVRVVVGEHHETLVRALRLLGIGSDAVVRVATREDGTVDVGALDAELERDPDAPTIVALAAGDLNRGAFDPFEEACDAARRHGAWVHVDGAFGLWAAASPRLRPLVHGIERADSWATDAHKWLNVPYDSGIVFVADPEAHMAAMSVPADYRVDIDDLRNQVDWGPDWSRRARGFALYATLRTLGRDGVASIVESCCDRAAELVAGLAELPGVEVLARPVINQGLVRFLDTGGDHDARTLDVIRRVNESGVAWFGPTTWNGMRVMRVSVSNFRTRPDDIERSVAAIRESLAR